MPKIIIGTRGSLLAVAQSSLVKSQLESLAPEYEFEIKTLKTQGDVITDKPLWQLDGKDFFTKELDQALLSNEVDLVIHSYKDLSSERPKGISLGCITKRDFPEDILLFKKSNLEKLKKKTSLSVGTSSPRRIYALQQKLLKFFPTQASSVQTKMLRGNVNTRISKLLNDEYDAIVLALAGLERLCHSETSYETILSLLSPLDFILLPLAEFPTAASQGALAIEYNQDGPNKSFLKDLLAKLNHDETAQEVTLEKKAFQKYGGGCHLAVGVNARFHGPDLLERHYGLDPEHKEVDFWSSALSSSRSKEISDNQIFIGLGKAPEDHPELLFDQWFQTHPLSPKTLPENHHIWVTSAHCLEYLGEDLPNKGLFVAGNKTFQKLTSRGFRVHASCEGLGYEQIQRFTSSRALNILLNSDENTALSILTGSDSSRAQQNLISCYERAWKPFSSQDIEKLKQAKRFYWSSYKQFQHFDKHLSFSTLSNVQHFCGHGKTLADFKQHGLDVTPCRSYKEIL